MTLLRRFLSLACLGALLLCSAGCTAPAAQTLSAATVSAAPASPAPASPAPTAEPRLQEGALQATLLDEKDLFAAASGYRFLENNGVELTVTAANYNGNPATIWFLFSELNGWDVSALPQSTSIVSLAPGEEKQETIRFDTSTGAARFLSLAALQSMTLAVEGYVDSSNYEYTMRESTFALPDAPGGYTQQYYPEANVLLSNDTLTIAYLGETEDGASAYYTGVHTPVEGGKCTLYRLENGLYDTEKYLVPDAFDLGAAKRRILLLAPAMHNAAPDTLYAVFERAALPPQALTREADASSARYDGGAYPVLAENESVRLRYDAATRRILAENLTGDTTLLLQLGQTFTLDGREIKANPQSILCFPRAATVFRVSGRGVDERNVERNITVTEGSHTLSAEWTVSACADDIAAPTTLGTIALDNAVLEG